MKIRLDEQNFNRAKPIINRIIDHGFEAYFVGGCVRDLLLERPIHDVDIASSALPDEIEAIFQSTIDLGKEHGTIIVVYQKETFEITTFRTESAYSDFRRPDQVSFVRNLREDTLRRDFTINAMALDVNGNLFDFHHGIEDLKQKLIRAVGIPTERFTEDALRMVRAIRFASELGFSIEAETFEAIQSLAENIQYLSIERIRIEMTKFFQGGYFPSSGHLLVTSRLANYMPGFDQFEVEPMILKMIAMMEPYIFQKKERVSEALVWMVFVTSAKMSESQIPIFLRLWKHSNQLIKDVLVMHRLLEKFITDTLTPKDIYDNSIDLLLELEEFTKSNNYVINESIQLLRQKLPIQSRKDIVITGNDIIDFLKLNHGGPIVGQIFDQVEEAIVNGNLTNNREAIKNYVLCKL